MRGRLDQVLAVVQDDEHLPPGERGDHALDRGGPAREPERERTGDGARHELRIGERPQLDQPDAVGEVGQQPPRDLERQPGLSNASGADQGQQAAGS